MQFASFRQSSMNYKMYMGDAEWRKSRTVPALKRSERMSRQHERQNSFPAERRLAEMAVLIKDVTTCKELRPLLQEYQRAADKKQFRRKHEGTLILYEAAAKALKEQGFQKLPDLYALKNEYKQLAEQKDQMQRQYNDAKRQMQEYGIIKQNVDGILRTAPGKEQMQER